MDLERNLGATAEMVQSGVDISPCGLGGVPTEGVAQECGCRLWLMVEVWLLCRLPLLGTRQLLDTVYRAS